MIAVPNQYPMTPAEYLEWEAKQDGRYEYLDGDVYAMTGGTLDHNTIAINLTALLKNHVRGRGCQLFMSDVKVQRSETSTAYFYPDLAVTCSPDDQQSTTYLKHPCLIVEVLSPSTESYDRGEKFAHYRHLASLQEYVLISSTHISVEIFRLNERQKWELTPYAAGETVRLTSVDVEFAIELLYEAVSFLPQAL